MSSALRVLNEEESVGVQPLAMETVHLLKEKHSPASDSEELRLHSLSLYTELCYLRNNNRRDGAEKKSPNTQHCWSLRREGCTACSAAHTVVVLLMTLCNTLVALARKLANTTCHHLDAFTSCRLIPLDKKPDADPLGSGKSYSCRRYMYHDSC